MPPPRPFTTPATLPGFRTTTDLRPGTGATITKPSHTTAATNTRATNPGGIVTATNPGDVITAANPGDVITAASPENAQQNEHVAGSLTAIPRRSRKWGFSPHRRQQPQAQPATCCKNKAGTTTPENEPTATNPEPKTMTATHNSKIGATNPKNETPATNPGPKSEATTCHAETGATNRGNRTAATNPRIETGKPNRENETRATNPGGVGGFAPHIGGFGGSSPRVTKNDPGGRKRQLPTSQGQSFVGKGGVEPPRPFGHTDLNRARLPFRHLPVADAPVSRCCERLARNRQCY
ncbi:hypothetical protein GCM10009555_019400 [Acrocarpospora macrocephala]|uniref:Uncharacterized protein n=1 Tax=Acrocarpospora macrocephala TaxID=150177 RepID=A0A5M3WIA3_9ACTN|nr:hypothetical protein Amac_016550 [Acrocarpospora macrocephala]